MSQKKYWQSFGEVNDSENFQKKQQDEFREELPFEGFDDKGLIDAKAPRRDFLKYLGFSTAAATLAASCKVPVRKVIPYANKPENLMPGVAKYYATTYVQDGDVVPVVAKVRDGRPIKIEGNELCSFTGGGTSARTQASVLDLYDSHRLRFPIHKTGSGKEAKYEEVPTFEQFDKLVGEAIKNAGGTTVLLTSTIVSPSTKEIIAAFPGLKHVQADAVSYSGMLLANEACGFGRKLPSYDFGAAKVIVSLGADFLGTWLSPVENAKGYATGRKIDEKNPSMSKHYQFESYLSLTGASADERFTHRPSEEGAVALELLNALTGEASTRPGIKKVAEDLKANNGAALVVSGSNDKNVQVIVNAINNAIGAYGKTIDWSKPVNYRQGIDSDFAQLLSDMEAGTVGSLLVYGANPAYTSTDAARFTAALGKVKVKVSFSERMDETTELCDFILPNHHYLESWGDAEPKAGAVSFLQPTIYPLFKTRPYQTSLLYWAGNNTDYDVYFKNYWVAKLGGEDAFNKVLQDGIKEDAAVAASAGSYSAAAVAEAVAAIGAAKKSTGTEVVLYQKTSIGTGTGATNPWLQELPDAISKATWDNYALIGLGMAKTLLGLDLVNGSEKESNNYEYFPQKPVIKLTVGKNEVELPVLVIPGMDANTIAVAVGYGRSINLGRTAAGVGKNVYPFSSYNGSTVIYHADVTAADAKKKEKIAQTQIHNSYEERIEVVRETTLATLKKYPTVIPDYRTHLESTFGKSKDGTTTDFRKEGTLYPQHDQPGIKWGMNIDMNACYGCGACVVACHAENNVPVVGKSEVLRYHDMHWLRIDRYFVSDEKDPNQLKGVVFQPMLCQHCDNAPCENVCPVAATNHSSEGINQMTYNRCIGTRYCANNCPFKVRRFNWADYTGADSFPNNQDQELVGKLDPVVFQMNDDLTRMVLNPDVTVRSRGVIEKCSFCFQRLQAAKLEAKKQDRPLKDGDAKTACQSACAANAIVFGNVHDSSSAIAKTRKENANRGFYVLEQLHVLPNVSYLAKVRNTDELIEPDTHNAAVAAEEKAGSTEKKAEEAHH
ncbi:MAG: TAT-variant-translocated molybdopterin oxidoreductase [Sphingobacteriales bacterium]|nr:TAT-variant-translocated molybdopterin oxidoreductase [Sphingobacteriales bacterium]